MNSKNWRERAYILMIIGVIQGLILTTLAMIFYAGGTAVNNNAPGYSFWANFFSDTGRTKAWSGRDNTISYIIFTITLTIYGIIMIPFNLAFSQLFNETSKEKKLSKIASLFVIITGIFFVGIAFTPYDVYSNEHILFVLIAFLALFLSSVFYTIAMNLSKSYPNRYMYTYLIFAIISGIYYIIAASWIFGDPTNITATGLIIQATAQKVVVYALHACFLIQSYGAWNQIKSKA